MSRGPNKEQIAELLSSIEISRNLLLKIAKAIEAANQLPKLEEEWRENKSNIIRLLEEMDCKSPGNRGWEARITILLEELIAQKGANN